MTDKPKVMAFANPANHYVQDVAVQQADGTYLSHCYGETLEQMRERVQDPAIEMVDLDEFSEMVDDRNVTDPVEITEEQYIDALEVLPPMDWVMGETSSFYMSEFYSGSVTSIYVARGGRYFKYRDRVKPHHDRVAKVRQWLEKQEAQG